MKFQSRVRGVLAACLMAAMTEQYAHAGGARVVAEAISKLEPFAAKTMAKVESPVAKTIGKEVNIADRAFLSNVAERTAFSRVAAGPASFPTINPAAMAQALKAPEAMRAAELANAARGARAAKKEVEAARVVASAPVARTQIASAASAIPSSAQTAGLASAARDLRLAMGGAGRKSQEAGAMLRTLEMDMQRIGTRTRVNSANAVKDLQSRQLAQTQAIERSRTARDAERKLLAERQLQDRRRASAVSMKAKFDEVRDPGVVYLRIDPRKSAEAGRYYIGQSKKSATYGARRAFHDAGLGVKHEYQVVTTALPGADLNVAEEAAIRAAKGTANLANKRVQINAKTYETVLGGISWAK